MQITNREQATSLGLKRFFTGNPCKNGHISERFTKDGKCVECNRLACRARHHRRVHSDQSRLERSLSYAETLKKARIRREVQALKRISRNSENALFTAGKRAGQSRYKTNRACPKGHRGERYIPSRTCCECSREWGTSETRKIYDREYNEENKEKISSRSKRYFAENHSKVLKSVRLWAKNNKDKVKAIKHNYKVRRRALIAEGVSSARLAEWVERQKKWCYWCGENCLSGYHIDHYVPLSKGGKHDTDNMVISCPKCNIRKNAKDPYDFANEMGKLF